MCICACSCSIHSTEATTANTGFDPFAAFKAPTATSTTSATSSATGFTPAFSAFSSSMYLSSSSLSPSHLFLPLSHIHFLTSCQVIHLLVQIHLAVTPLALQLHLTGLQQQPWCVCVCVGRGEHIACVLAPYTCCARASVHMFMCVHVQVTWASHMCIVHIHACMTLHVCIRVYMWKCMCSCISAMALHVLHLPFSHVSLLGVVCLALLIHLVSHQLLHR